MNSQATNAAIDLSQVDQSPQAEAVEENNQSTAPKTHVSQLILRTTTNGFMSRSESGQANVGFIGGVQRGQISSNARTSAIRQAFPDLIPDLKIFEVRGRNIAQTIWRMLEEEATELPLALRFNIAHITAFVGVQAGKIIETVDQKKVGHRGFIKARDERIEFLNQVGDIESLSDEDREFVEMPWKGVIPEEDTVQAKSILCLKSIVRWALEGEGRSRGNRNKPIAEMSLTKLVNEIREIMVDEKQPALASAAFGAMQADLPAASVFGGVSINQAFTTGPAQIKQSFWTAVGDKQEGRQDAGADCMGTKELTSGVFVEPSLTNVTQMRTNLDYLKEPGQFSTAMTGLQRALLTVTANGGQRSNVTRSMPEFVVNVISRLQPLSFESAFVKPVQSGSEEGDMIASAQQLVNHLQDFKCFAGEMGKDYEIIILGTPTVMAALENIPEDWTVVKSMDELIDTTNALTGV